MALIGRASDLDALRSEIPRWYRGGMRVTSLEYPLRAEITLARDVTNSLGAEESSGEGKKEKKGTEKYRTRSRYREASDDASDKTPLRSGLTDLTALSLSPLSSPSAAARSHPKNS